MAFDQSTRNLLANLVSECRRLLSAEFTAKLQELYGIQPTGEVADVASLTQLTDEQREVARLLRERIAHIQAGLTAGGAKPEAAARDAVQRVIREQAFTVLNRLAALRLSEERGLVLECVRQGVNSEGFQLFRQSAGSALGDSHETYVAYLHCLFDDLAQDLGVLFDRFSPMALLFPRRDTLTRVLAELSGTGPTAAREKLGAEIFAQIWQADETIGWIYQYWNDPAERKKMREESSAPRNSRELAVRNQFFTPRYVVEFLTDNTLGRIWYEMTQGATTLKEHCRYLVRRPNEIFLKPGETAPEQAKQDNLSQEDLLKQPVHIPHRPLKDPRTILMLDPACGSMHFGLYAFDLFEVIYDEAWELEEKLGAEALSRPPGMKPLRDTYAGKDAFLKDVPRLIIEHNLHGIDIDPRCAQIAGLSLWLRAQKAWQRLGLKPAERPAIKRSNIVCAEPMPGEKELLREFVEREFPAAERAVCLRLLEAIFDKMQLAGEAGSLLKIEEEIRSAIEDARDAWQKLATRPPELFTTTELNQLSTAPELTGLEQAVSSLTTDTRHLTTDFWERIEERIYAALRDYAEQAENGGGFQRRLFAEDAARGFAFIDVCRKRYDVAVMNPPFGAPSLLAEDYIENEYPLSKNDIYGCFIEEALVRRADGGLVGALTSRTWMFLPRRQDIRLGVIDANSRVHCLADLGHGVLDAAMVETCAFCLAPKGEGLPSTFIRLVDAVADNKESRLREALGDSGHSCRFDVLQDRFKLLPGAPFAYWISDRLFELLADASRFGDEWEIGPGLTTRDNVRFLRSPLEVSRSNLGKTWFWFAKGGSFSPYYFDTELVLNYAGDGKQIKAWISSLGESVTTFIANQRFYFQPGFTYPRVTDKGFNVRVLRAGHVFAEKGISIFPKSNAGPTLGALAYLNSSLVQELLLLMAPSRSWEKTFVASLPALRGDLPNLEASAKKIVTLLTESLLKDSTSNLFLVLPTDSSVAEGFSAINTSQKSAAMTVRHEAQAVSDLIRDEFKCIGKNPDEFQNDPWEAAFVIRDTADYSALLVDYGVGVAIGRWDIRYATGEQAAPELPDPFAPLPVCPPGQLQNAQGLPAHPEDVPAAYPVRIPWDGILVDDPNHPLDLERRVREVLEIIWSGQAGGPTAEAIEHEACEILGVKSLRDYFRKPAGFFADHLKRYSKSRRQAPIYWPLSTASGSYTLWIYYHRLTDQTLYKCIQQFIDPRLADVEKELAHLRSVLDSGEGSTKTRRQLDDAEQLRTELKEMRAELEHWASRWKPNLNDGVLITACPLWKLFRLPKWRKDLETCWKEMEAGDYDWAHLAHTLWPDRVRQNCKTDRSLAIAHGLEALCEVAAPKPKAKRAAKADAAAKEREAKKEELREQLTEALANIFLGQKLPIDITNAHTGEKVIPADRKITKTLLRKLAGLYDHVEMDHSPARDRIREIIAPFAHKFVELELTEQGELAMEAD